MSIDCLGGKCVEMSYLHGCGLWLALFVPMAFAVGMLLGLKASGPEGGGP